MGQKQDGEYRITHSCISTDFYKAVDTTSVEIQEWVKKSGLVSVLFSFLYYYLLSF